MGESMGVHLQLPIDRFFESRREVFKKFNIKEFPISLADESIQSRQRPAVGDVLKNAPGPLFQPRCGVQNHADMKAVLTLLQDEGSADVLTLTVDSYTRLNFFDRAASEKSLNGYPVVFHGSKAIRELEDSLKVPLQVRHGSPDGRILAEVTYAGGLTAFEGGGISYNLPYCKKVSLAESLRCYQYIDRLTGYLSEKVAIDRETFGSLTAVLVPPSISIAISLIEAGLAVEQGVRCVTVSYPQSGSLAQDVAALEVIREFTPIYLQKMGLDQAEIFTSFHQWMGVFPKDSAQALALISSAVTSAILGRATKTIVKTHQEALGIPDPTVNAFSLRFCKSLAKNLLNHTILNVNRDEIDEEKYWLKREVTEILNPIFHSAGQDLVPVIVNLFNSGMLDIPFPASRAAKGNVIPTRDRRGYIRYLQAGSLPLSDDTLKHNNEHLKYSSVSNYKGILNDIYSVASQEYEKLGGVS